MATRNSIPANLTKLATAGRKDKTAEITEQFDMAYEQCEAACAIIDAATILASLEHAPAHHDMHPDHNIITGAGHAHGLRVKSDTMPKMLAHARHLVELSMNDFDVMREVAITELQEVGAA